MGIGISIASEEGSGSSRRRPSLAMWLLLAPVLLWMTLFVVIPSITLVAMSFAERDGLGRVVQAFTPANYERALSHPWPGVFWDSLRYAGITTLACLILGYPAGYIIGRSPPQIRTTLVLLIMIPLWTSFLIRTYAWITILGKEGLLNGLLVAAGWIDTPLQMLYTPGAVVLGLVYNYLPFMILPIYASAEKLDQELLDASRDLGHGSLRTFWRVALPLTLPGVAAGCLLVLVPSLAMFAVTTLMGGGSHPTIGEVIQNQFTKARNPPFGAALGTILLLGFYASLIAWVVFLEVRKGKRSSALPR